MQHPSNRSSWKTEQREEKERNNQIEITKYTINHFLFFLRAEECKFPGQKDSSSARDNETRETHPRTHPCEPWEHRRPEKNLNTLRDQMNKGQRSEMAWVISAAPLEAKFLHSGRLSIKCIDIFSYVSSKSFTSFAHPLRMSLEGMHDQNK